MERVSGVFEVTRVDEGAVVETEAIAEVCRVLDGGRAVEVEARSVEAADVVCCVVGRVAVEVSDAFVVVCAIEVDG